MTIQILFRSLIGLAIGISAFAQGGGGRPPTSGGGPPTIPTNPGTSRTPTNNNPFPTNNPNSSIPDIQRPIYISGKVLMDDGTPPPDSVALQFVCSASPRTIGYTDSKGGFSVDLTNRTNMAIYSDASETGSFGRPNGMGGNPMGAAQQGRGNLTNPFMGCDLRAYLAGFRSDTINLSNRRPLENPEVGTIIIHRLANVEGLTISATTALAPKDARKAYEKGRNLLKKEKSEEAQREFQKAVDEYPKFAAAWFELGKTQEQSKDVEGARKSYSQALVADPKFLSPYQQLAMIAIQEKKWDEVADDTSHWVKLNPVDFPQAWFYNALANYELKKMDVAEKSAREGLTADSGNHYPKMNHLLAVILAQKSDFAGAAEYMRNYLKLVPLGGDSELVKKQLAEVEKLAQPQAKKE